MSNLRLLFLLLIVSQSVLFGQKDSVKKNFKPYGLIDAAPVAINKDDFKPSIILTINAVDAISNASINTKFDYYTVGDTVINTENGKVISLTINGNQKIAIVSNAKGYIWQTQTFETPFFDTSYVLKLTRINKGDIVTKQTIDLNAQNIHSESAFFVQDVFRRRDPQILRLNFNWRFGKFDANLFKRKNNKNQGGDGTENMNMGQ